MPAENHRSPGMLIPDGMKLAFPAVDWVPHAGPSTVATPERSSTSLPFQQLLLQPVCGTVLDVSITGCALGLDFLLWVSLFPFAGIAAAWLCLGRGMNISCHPSVPRRRCPSAKPSSRARLPRSSFPCWRSSSRPEPRLTAETGTHPLGQSRPEGQGQGRSEANSREGAGASSPCSHPVLSVLRGWNVGRGSQSRAGCAGCCSPGWLLPAPGPRLLPSAASPSQPGLEASILSHLPQ